MYFLSIAGDGTLGIGIGIGGAVFWRAAAAAAAASGISSALGRDSGAVATSLRPSMSNEDFRPSIIVSWMMQKIPKL